jgi:deazaflavin-dependent oxidoreductase (nitroreductase family)
MSLPRSVARFNRHVTNRLLGRLAPVLPGFGIVEHVGRRSGRVFRTPVNVFRRPGGYIIALTYGPNSDWVRNVLARGGCVLQTRGRRLRLVNARLVHDPRRRGLPTALRWVGALGDVADFVTLDLAEAATDAEPARRPAA